MDRVDQRKQAERAALEAQVAEFLSRGGRIQQVPSSVYKCPRLTAEDRRMLEVGEKNNKRRRDDNAA
jgi:hypothetical protein